MSNPLDDINQFLKEYFGENLVSLVVFGSYSKKPEFRIASDIDYFIVLNHVHKAQSSISREIKGKLSHVFPLIAFNIYSRSDFQKIIDNNYWLVLSLNEGYTIIEDKDSYFETNIKSKLKDIKSTKIGKLSWFVENQKFSPKLLKHYNDISDDFYKAADIVFQTGQTHVALELLLRSVHTFMIGKLMTRNIYITSGEITQMFFNIFIDNSIAKFKNTFLRLEQNTGQYYSFGFNKTGQMSFGEADSKKGKQIFKSCYSKLIVIKKKFL